MAELTIKLDELRSVSIDDTFDIYIRRQLHQVSVQHVGPQGVAFLIKVKGAKRGHRRYVALSTFVSSYWRYSIPNNL